MAYIRAHLSVTDHGDHKLARCWCTWPGRRGQFELPSRQTLLTADSHWLQDHGATRLTWRLSWVVLRRLLTTVSTTQEEGILPRQSCTCVLLNSKQLTGSALGWSRLSSPSVVVINVVHHPSLWAWALVLKSAGCTWYCESVMYRSTGWNLERTAHSCFYFLHMLAPRNSNKFMALAGALHGFSRTLSASFLFSCEYSNLPFHTINSQSSWKKVWPAVMLCSQVLVASAG